MLCTEQGRVIAVQGEGFYLCYRIPGILPAVDGALLLCCEARTHATSDWGDIDVILWRLEADGSLIQTHKIGCSHLPPDGSLRTYNNPVLIPDGESVHLIYHLNYQRAYIITSDDGGRAWSDARDITQAYDEFPCAWNVCATGPGHGIQMNNGRLIAPIWLANDEVSPDGQTRMHWPSVAGCIYSDDHGRTWHAGALAQGEGIVNGNETTVARLPDGRLLFNHRNMNDEHVRVLGLSANGESIDSLWPCRQLPDPMCFGGMAAGKKGVLFGNCVSKEKRIDAAVKYSQNAGSTWEKIWDVDEKAGYIDIAYTGGISMPSMSDIPTRTGL